MKVFDFLNHASIKCHYNGLSVITDPWVISNSFGSWYPNPSPRAEDIYEIDSDEKMGGASIAGRVKIGNFSTIETNATVLPNLKIGTNVYIGAEAVVTKDVEDNLIMAGVPAKPISKNELSFDASMFE